MSDTKLTKAVMPFSGGMDSAVMLRMFQSNFSELHLLTFDYGQRHVREIECAKTQVEHAKLLACQADNPSDANIIHKIIDVSFIKDIANTSSLTNLNINNPDVKDMVGEAQPSSYVPFRNQLFLTIACAYAESIGAESVFHGATNVDSLAGYWDGSDEFLQNFNDLIKLNRKSNIQILCPLLHMSKKDIVIYGVRNQVDLYNTYTCYSGNELSDATTPSSALRIKGFGEAGYIDPIPYKQDLSVFWSEYNCKEIEDGTKKFLTTHGTRGG